MSTIYWCLGIAFLLMMFGHEDKANATSVSYNLMVGILACSPLVFIIVKHLTYKVIVDSRKITATDIFSKKTALITQHSLVYTRQNFQSINFIIRRYDYVITIVNRNESVNINANVSNADGLFQAVRNIEKEQIFPYWIKKFIEEKTLKFGDKLTLQENGIMYGKKFYDYSSLSSISIQNGRVHFKKAGALWQTSILTIPCGEIPNLQTFIAIIHQTSELM